MDLMVHGWERVTHLAVAGENVAVVADHFTLPDFNLFSTFRVLCDVYAAGNVIVELRFGFNDADADACTLGITFPAIGALNASFYRSQVWDIAGLLPDTVGNPLSVLPPRGSVIITSPVATDLTFGLYVACIGGN